MVNGRLRFFNLNKIVYYGCLFENYLLWLRCKYSLVFGFFGFFEKILFYSLDYNIDLKLVVKLNLK